MRQTRFELKKENGEYISLDELYDLAMEEIESELNITDEDEALDLGNEIRECKGYDTLYKNDEENLNDQLADETPYDILNSGWDDYDDYFTWDGCRLETTSNVWYNLSTARIAEEILDGEYSRYLPYDVRNILVDYEEAKEFLENLNPYKAMAEEVIAKYVNCEADVTDLLQVLDKLARTDEAWK